MKLISVLNLQQQATTKPQLFAQRVMKERKRNPQYMVGIDRVHKVRFRYCKECTIMDTRLDIVTL